MTLLLSEGFKRIVSGEGGTLIDSEPEPWQRELHCSDQKCMDNVKDVILDR